MTNEEMDGMIDGLLRERFEGPVPADDFCDRVMDRLPARRRRSNWPLAAGALAGMTTCWFSLWSAGVTYAGWRDWLAGQASASAMALFIAMIGMAILALVWTIAEADERYDPASRRIIR